MELFFFSIATGLNPWQLKRKKRERTARPVVFTEGHAQIKVLKPFAIIKIEGLGITTESKIEHKIGQRVFIQQNP